MKCKSGDEYKEGIRSFFCFVCLFVYLQVRVNTEEHIQHSNHCTEDAQEKNEDVGIDFKSL